MGFLFIASLALLLVTDFAHPRSMSDLSSQGGRRIRCVARGGGGCIKELAYTSISNVRHNRNPRLGESRRSFGPPYWWQGSNNPFRIGCANGGINCAPVISKPISTGVFNTHPSSQKQIPHQQNVNLQRITVPMLMGVCPAKYICVHWQLCKNGFLITDGTGVIDKSKTNIPFQISSTHTSCGDKMICCGISTSLFETNLPHHSNRFHHQTSPIPGFEFSSEPKPSQKFSPPHNLKTFEETKTISGTHIPNAPMFPQIQTFAGLEAQNVPFNSNIGGLNQIIPSSVISTEASLNVNRGQAPENVQPVDSIVPDFTNLSPTGQTTRPGFVRESPQKEQEAKFSFDQFGKPDIAEATSTQTSGSQDKGKIKPDHIGGQQGTIGKPLSDPSVKQHEHSDSHDSNQIKSPGTSFFSGNPQAIVSNKPELGRGQIGTVETVPSSSLGTQFSTGQHNVAGVNRAITTKPSVFIIRFGPPPIAVKPKPHNVPGQVIPISPDSPLDTSNAPFLFRQPGQQNNIGTTITKIPSGSFSFGKPLEPGEGKQENFYKQTDAIKKNSIDPFEAPLLSVQSRKPDTVETTHANVIGAPLTFSHLSDTGKTEPEIISENKGNIGMVQLPELPKTVVDTHTQIPVVAVSSRKPLTVEKIPPENTNLQPDEMENISPVILKTPFSPWRPSLPGTSHIGDLQASLSFGLSEKSGTETKINGDEQPAILTNQPNRPRKHEEKNMPEKYDAAAKFDPIISTTDLNSFSLAELSGVSQPKHPDTVRITPTQAEIGSTSSNRQKTEKGKPEDTTVHVSIMGPVKTDSSGTLFLPETPETSNEGRLQLTFSDDSIKQTGIGQDFHRVENSPSFPVKQSEQIPEKEKYTPEKSDKIQPNIPNPTETDIKSFPLAKPSSIEDGHSKKTESAKPFIHSASYSPSQPGTDESIHENKRTSFSTDKPGNIAIKEEYKPNKFETSVSFPSLENPTSIIDRHSTIPASAMSFFPSKPTQLGNGEETHTQGEIPVNTGHQKETSKLIPADNSEKFDTAGNKIPDSFRTSFPNEKPERTETSYTVESHTPNSFGSSWQPSINLANNKEKSTPSFAMRDLEQPIKKEEFNLGKPIGTGSVISSIPKTDFSFSLLTNQSPNGDINSKKDETTTAILTSKPKHPDSFDTINKHPTSSSDLLKEAGEANPKFPASESSSSFVQPGLPETSHNKEFQTTFTVDSSTHSDDATTQRNKNTNFDSLFKVNPISVEKGISIETEHEAFPYPGHSEQRHPVRGSHIQTSKMPSTSNQQKETQEENPQYISSKESMTSSVPSDTYIDGTLHIQPSGTSFSSNLPEVTKKTEHSPNDISESFEIIPSDSSGTSKTPDPVSPINEKEKTEPENILKSGVFGTTTLKPTGVLFEPDQRNTLENTQSQTQENLFSSNNKQETSKSGQSYIPKQPDNVGALSPADNSGILFLNGQSGQPNSLKTTHPQRLGIQFPSGESRVTGNVKQEHALGHPGIFGAVSPNTLDTTFLHEQPGVPTNLETTYPQTSVISSTFDEPEATGKVRQKAAQQVGTIGALSPNTLQTSFVNGQAEKSSSFGINPPQTFETTSSGELHESDKAKGYSIGVIPFSGSSDQQDAAGNFYVHTPGQSQATGNIKSQHSPEQSDIINSASPDFSVTSNSHIRQEHPDNFGISNSQSFGNLFPTDISLKTGTMKKEYAPKKPSAIGTLSSSFSDSVMSDQPVRSDNDGNILSKASESSLYSGHSRENRGQQNIKLNIDKASHSFTPEQNSGSHFDLSGKPLVQQKLSSNIKAEADRLSAVETGSSSTFNKKLVPGLIETKRISTYPADSFQGLPSVDISSFSGGQNLPHSVERADLIENQEFVYPSTQSHPSSGTSNRNINMGLHMMGGNMMMGNMVMTTLLGTPLLGGSCSAGTYCISREECNPYNGFIIMDTSRIAAAFPDSPTVPLLDCFVPAGGIQSGVCCQLPHPIIGLNGQFLD